MKVVLASRNPGKLRELRALLPSWEIEPADTSEVEETGALPMRRERSAPMSLDPPLRSQSRMSRLAKRNARTSAAGWSATSIIQLIVSG